VGGCWEGLRGHKQLLNAAVPHSLSGLWHQSEGLTVFAVGGGGGPSEAERGSLRALEPGTDTSGAKGRALPASCARREAEPGAARPGSTKCRPGARLSLRSGKPHGRSLSPPTALGFTSEGRMLLKTLTLGGEGTRQALQGSGLGCGVPHGSQMRVCARHPNGRPEGSGRKRERPGCLTSSPRGATPETQAGCQQPEGDEAPLCWAARGHF